MGAPFYEPAALTAELWARNMCIIAYLYTLGKRKKAVLPSLLAFDQPDKMVSI